MKRIIKIISFCFFLMNFIVQAQYNEEDSPKIIVSVRVKKDSIALRWAVNNKFAWKYGNEYGYVVERTTVLRDGEPVQPPEKIILAGAPIKPKSMPEWENYIQTNDAAAVVAQAIYGESFVINKEEDASAVMKVVLENEELNNRFGFSLYAVDQDYEVAKFAGLGYTDTNVKVNEKYLYNIKSAIPEEKLKVAPSGVFVSPSEAQELPKPIDFFGYYYKESFVLVWEYDQLLSFYGSYDIERSSDGVSFDKINSVPITKLADTPSTGISFTDSVPQYNKPYWYRIKGKSNFNEISLASDTLKLIGIKELTQAAVFTSSEIISKSQVELKWEFPDEELWKLKKYELLRAEKAPGPYTIVVDSISPKSYTYTYGPIADINYFKLKAVGHGSDYVASFPTMVQPIDSVPPKVPQGLKGTIDTLGVVRLTWDKNEELDLNGYNILKSNRPDQEFSKLNVDYLKSESYMDTIDMTSFTTAVYYKIFAMDNRYNESEASEILMLKKPDRIPPTSPVITNYKVVDNKVNLNWTNSSSEDAIGIAIYRQNNTEENLEWEKIYTVSNDTVTAYQDSKINPGKKYAYTILAIDETGLESEPSVPIYVDISGELLKEGVKGLYATVDRENKFIDITWRFNNENAQEIQMYRKSEGEPYNLYKILEPTTSRFMDKQLIPNTTYGYGFKAIFKDGSISEWEEIIVEY